MKEILWLDSEDFRDQIINRNEKVKEAGLSRGNGEIVNWHTDWPEYLKDIEIEITSYKESGFFAISRYLIKKNGNVIADIWRNYSAYPQSFVNHSNGKRYFICGFDYQGYTIVNLDDEITNHYLPNEAMKGWGWCPTNWDCYDPKENTIEAEGCYWGASFDKRTYDFSNPEVLPLPLLREAELYDDAYDEDESFDDEEEDEGEE